MTTTTKPALLEQHTIAERRVTFLPLDLFKKSTHVQVREEVNADTVARYAETYAAGTGMPPIVVFVPAGHKPEEGGELYLADGHHRLAGAKKAKLAEINVVIKRGDRRAALLYALSANHQHGLPLTNDDKRRSVGLMLADDEWRAWSDRTIAEACRVSATLVAKCRAALPADQQSKVRKSKDGRVRNTAKIGKSKPAPEPEPEYPSDSDLDARANPHAGNESHADTAAVIKAQTEGDTEPEELNAATVRATFTAPASLTVKPTTEPTTALSADQSQVAVVIKKQRESLADELDNGKHRWHADDRKLVALACIVGIPTSDEPTSWADDLVANCYTILADRLKAEVVDRLRRQDAARLPPLIALANWWGIDIRVIEHTAERRAR
jgi:ParB-like chromosome segregation protein Spo0J